ncbi:hypothetical protein FPZ43_13910 [Mucilaginibacter pallidiroseus]|uniref:Nucleotide-diphospho-sugar transferase domain-containing protein n=1 Tax=Mucilaginibacter pallidiroseus TaxID=2599295 RepID=A0A563U855_9SPHI|nr:hypothetical protein [Mucilaginibacter pallidiroseus]TWR27561.1 hypothetical protein FPZ43_13910 [Mucilaginibacter pallidiroseus]
MNRFDNSTLTETGNKPLPIFFLQLGNKVSLFFDKVLEQAALTNGAANIYVLTDCNFVQYSKYNCIDISRYAYGTTEFDGLYEHHSKNSFFFEKTCFDRWFMINAMVKALNIDWFFYADSDVLIVENLNPIFENLKAGGYTGSTMRFELAPGRSITSAHSSFWSSSLLNDFCNFICNRYRDKEAFAALLEDTLSGKFLDNTNMSDMIMLDVFGTEIQPAVLNLFSLEDNNINFDFNVNVAYNGHKHTFAMHPVYKVKQLLKKADAVYGVIKDSKVDAQLCRFYTLHFQGYITKTLIPIYATPQNLKEAITNRILGEYNFTVRKMRVFKNQVKQKAQNIARKV